MQLEQLTHDIALIARLGGDYLRQARKDFHSDLVEKKHAHDYVSYVDRNSEKLLVEKLHTLLPEAAFITEEATVEQEQSAELQFVIDPLDGTSNYIRDNAPYCVCIALRSKTELLVGVVYEVCRDELYTAYKGGPALLNGNSIHVSDVDNLNDAYAFLELPYNTAEYKHTGEWMYRQLYGRVACLRMPGSAAAALCYLAAGRFDIWFESFIGRWDYSAAALIVRQAGGTVTDFFGRQDIMNTNHIAASNGLLHPQIIDMLQGALPYGIQ